MKNPSLEVINSRLERHIRLVESYSEIKGLGFIIKSCRLKSHRYVFQTRDRKVELHRWWFDEFGNSLHLDGKKPRLVENDLSIPRTHLISTDLYYGFSLEKIVKISKLMYVSFGKDDDMQQDCVIVAFLGIDNYLRCFTYLYGEWTQVSPLLLGMQTLKTIAENRDIKFFKKIDGNETLSIPCAEVEQWLSFMPVRSEFLSLLTVHCQPLSVLFQDKG